MFCSKCGNELGEERFCSKCGTANVAGQTQLAATMTAAAAPNLEIFANAYPGVSEKYRRRFADIDASGGGFKVKWSWWAFGLTPFWYLAQGMWAKALIIIVVSLFSGGAMAPLFWIYGGVCGTYDYYLLKVKNKQLW